MERRYQLTQLLAAVEENLPAGTLVLDTTGNASVFFKYKGTLVERDSLDFNLGTLRSRIKYSVSRGSTLAIKIHHEDDISEFLVYEGINPDIMNRNKITQQYLDTLSSGRDDPVLLDKDYRFTIVINGTTYPQYLQKYIDQGDLIPIIIT